MPKRMPMSTPEKDNLSRESVIPCDRYFVVEKGRETLADYVRRIRSEKRLSLAEVSHLSGSQITRSHISRIENGELTNVGLDKLRALSKGLGVAEEEVFAIARGESPIADPDFGASFFGMLYEKFVKVPEDRREYILSLFRMIDREMETFINLSEWNRKMGDPKFAKRIYENIDRQLGDPLGTTQRDYLDSLKDKKAPSNSKRNKKTS